MKAIQILFLLSVINLNAQDFQLKSILQELNDPNCTIKGIEEKFKENVQLKEEFANYFNAYDVTFSASTKEDRSFRIVFLIKDRHQLILDDFGILTDIMDELFIHQGENFFKGVKGEESFVKNYISTSDLKIDIARFSKGCLVDRNNVAIIIKE